VKKKLFAALLPVVAFAAIALTPALAQAANVTLKVGSTNVPVNAKLKFKGGAYFSLYSNVGPYECEGELIGKVTENPGATIEITESNFGYEWEDGRCPMWTSQGEVSFEPSISSGHTFKVQKTGTSGYFAFNEVPTRIDYYYNSTSEHVGECITSLNSEGLWSVGSSDVKLEGSLLLTEAPNVFCEEEIPMEAYFKATQLDGTTLIKIQ
jgi:hypothetical protein